MLKVRTSVVNGTLDRDYAVAERWARPPFRRAACPPTFWTVSAQKPLFAIDAVTI
jgi:hypothetical protein